MSGHAKWEHFHHPADVGVRGWGATPAEAFAQAALAMTAVITEPQCVRNRTCIEVRCQAGDLEYLLVAWLNALVYEMATRSMLFSVFEVHIEGTRLRARVCGERLHRDRHQPAVEVKGATLSELQVCERDGRWCAQCVVDV